MKSKSKELTILKDEKIKLENENIEYQEMNTEVTIKEKDIKITSLNNKNLQMDIELQLLKKEKHKISEKLSKIQVEVETTRKQSKGKDKDIEILESELKTSKQKLKSLTESQLKLTESQMHTNGRLHELESTNIKHSLVIEQLHSERDSLMKHIEEQQSEMSELKVKYADQLNTLQKQNAHIETLKREVKQHDSLEETSNVWKDKYSDLFHENQELQHKLDDFNQNLFTLNLKTRE